MKQRLTPTFILLVALGFWPVAIAAGEGAPTVASFVEGKVQILTGATWATLVEGEKVPAGSVVRTGPDGLADLSLGTYGVLHLSHKTSLKVRDLTLGPAQNAVEVSLTMGSIAAAVSHLGGLDRFNVATPTANLGVRGTRFAVTVAGQNSSSVGVQEGQVAVLPPNFNPALWDLAHLDAETERELKAQLAAVYDSGEQVSGGSELRINRKALREAAKVLAEAQRILPKAGPQRVERLKARLEELKKAVLKAAAVKSQEKLTTRPLSPEILDLFKEAKAVKGFVQRPEPKEEPKKAEDVKAKEPKPAAKN